MEEAIVKCSECGKKFKVFKTEFVHIPQYRCDDCLKEVRK